MLSLDGGVCMQSRWRHSVTEPYTRWRICVTMATLWQKQDGVYMLFYIFNSTVLYWTCFFYALLFSYIENFTGEGQVGRRIWPETCLEFHSPASSGEHRAVLLVAKSASGSVFCTLKNSTQRRNCWKHNSFSASQEFARILWNRKVHRRSHNSIPPVPILSQIYAIHVLNQFLDFEFYIILPSKPRSCKYFLSLRFPQQNPTRSSPSFVLHAPPYHSSLFGQ